MHHLTFKIHGEVQGVNFRYNIDKLAHELGLVGYVKNLPDGTVNLVAEGEEEALKKLLEYCKIGPSWASVSRLEEKWKDISGKMFEEFKIEY